MSKLEELTNEASAIRKDISVIAEQGGRTSLDELIQQYCPDGVEYVILSNIATIKRGERVTKSQLDPNGQYPVISGGVKPLGLLNKYNREANVITIAQYGTAGYIDWQYKKFWANDVCYSIYPNQEITNRYLYYALLNKQELIYSLKTNAIPACLPIDKLSIIEIPVPPLPVQEEIVRILDKFTELQAELQAELQKRKQQYNYYLDNLLKFNGGGHETEVKWMKLSEVASFTYGYTSKAQDLGDVRYIRITDITDKGQLNPKNGKYISLTEDVMPYLLQKGDLIMARTGATYGKTLYYNEDYPSAYASFLIKITLNQSVDSKYYWHFTRSSIYWEQANRLVGGGAQPQFNTGAISQVKIPIPPLEEQKRIADILDRFDRLTNDLSSGLPAEMEKRRQQYEYYRDRLLTFKRKEA